MGGHESMIKLLAENGAKLPHGDVDQLACIATEKNSINLLEDIMCCGGDVTLPSSSSIGTTPLHVAVSKGNVEIIKYLVDCGADIHKLDKYGWTLRTPANQQGHVDIKAIFESTGEPKAQSLASIPEKQPRAQSLASIPEKQSKVRYLRNGRFKSAMIMLLFLVQIAIVFIQVFLTT